MALTIKYGIRPSTHRFQYPCLDTTSYTNALVEATDILELPVQHRVKPDPLTLTGLGLQYTSARYSRTEKKVAQTANYCPGSPAAGYEESWKYALPSTSIPVVSEPNWALALRNKIQDDKVSFADTIGEWREAVKMLEDAGTIFKRALRFAKTLWRLRKNRRALKWWFKNQFGRDPDSKFELMDAVRVDLAIKFGIKPMAQLAWDSVEQLDRVLQMERRIQVTLKNEGTLNVAGRFGGVYTVKRTLSSRAIAFVRYDPNNREFTSGNLAEALWAGTRLSFMLDWFWNFGGYLSSFNAMGGVVSFRGVVCRRDTRTGVDRRVDFGSAYKVIREGRWVYKSYRRDLVSTIPMASLPEPSLPTSNIWGRLFSSIEVFASMRKASSLP